MGKWHTEFFNPKFYYFYFFFLNKNLHIYNFTKTSKKTQAKL